MFRKRRRGSLQPGEPLRHPDHPLPVSRRQFIAQGLMSGAATVIAPTALGLFSNPRAAEAALSADLEALKQSCGIAVQGAGKIPFICVDLAGGANMVGSNVLVGGQGGQLDFLSAAGYAKLGLPGDMVPGAPNPGNPANGLGLRKHEKSQESSEWKPSRLRSQFQVTPPVISAPAKPTLRQTATARGLINARFTSLPTSVEPPLVVSTWKNGSG